MMDTILNLGLNDETVQALATATKNERFAWDCYRRFVQMYGDVVLGVQKRAGEDHEPFRSRHRRTQARALSARTSTTPKLTADDQQGTRQALQGAVKERTGQEFPAGSVGAAQGRRRRRVRFLDERPRDRLPPQIQHSRRVGHRRQRAGDGLWQHRRTRPVPASPSPATPPTARTSSTASSSSTPRAKTSSPASARRSRSRS